MQVHTHPGDNVDVEIARAQEILMNGAENGELTTANVVGKAHESLSKIAKGRFPLTEVSLLNVQ